MPEIVIKDGDDWVEIAFDNQVIDEKLYTGHPLRSRDIVELLQLLGYATRLEYGEWQDDGTFKKHG